MGTTELRERGASLDGLTDKQKLFVTEYTKDCDGKRAAEACGYKNPSVISCQMLKHPKVSKAIGKILNGMVKTKELEREEILRQLYYCVTRDPLDLVDENGLFHTDLNNIPERMRACIDSFEIKQFTDYESGDITQEIKVRLVPKLGAIDLAMKHKGLFAPTQNTTHVTFDFDALARGRANATEDSSTDPVEAEIANVKKIAHTPTTIVVEPSPTSSPPNSSKSVKKAPSSKATE
jgi:hypothetical protein